jgi:hypothetical protein
MSRPPCRVLYIGGMGRSGSTVLQAMLGQLPGFVAAGELRYLWQRGPIDNVLCSCGEHFETCPFWMRVGEIAFGGWGELDAPAVVALQATVDRHRYLPQIVGPARRTDFAGRLERYVALVRRLYSGITSVSGGAVIVDSTKDPPHGFILQRTFGENFRLAHLVRDSRGVAYSWTKRVQRPEVTISASYMEQSGPATMALKWLDYNLLFHALRAIGAPTVLLRYEDLVREPATALERLIELVGETRPPGLLPGEGGSVEIRPEHTLSGNPLRFRTGSMPLHNDDEWKRRMPSSQRRMVSAITAPLLVAYGYAPGQVNIRRRRQAPPAPRDS